MCEQGGFVKTKKDWHKRDCFKPIQEKVWGKACFDCKDKEICAHAD